MGNGTEKCDLSITDLDALTVGDCVGFQKTFTDEDVRKFAEATGDTNALHLNEECAKQTRFGGLISHGTLVSGPISAAHACFPGLTIYHSQDLEFEGPARIGEMPVAVCEIDEGFDDDRYRPTTRIKNGDGERVLDGTATVLVDPLPS